MEHSLEGMGESREVFPWLMMFISLFPDGRQSGLLQAECAPGRELPSGGGSTMIVQAQEGEVGMRVTSSVRDSIGKAVWNLSVVRSSLSLSS